MYTPSSFRVDDLTTLHAFMERYSFAMLCSSTNGEQQATHLPLLLDRDSGPHGQLIGHMARANPQWKRAAGSQVMAIFAGPHAYISPTWYESNETVPTWNYAAVHAYGTFQPIEDDARLREIVRRTVDVYERSMPRPWSMDVVPPETIDKLLLGIVGFEIRIDRLEGKWKLNQNHPVERREKVVRALTATGRPDDVAIADLMRRQIDSESPT
ncbi:Protease synthase and sporulation protein PAI 2 [Caulifigura coniformis]|uniref:Protease synthase and sporulation protein PAI 2 n=1 Tax=Caulifigura coniformis TaxID=2527983 RepID=A0A517SKM5_9PLAN|nr:FMN-binding negative transcriptional regulator [Caulifigura coniformis]QDT56671.1 Protease synthase and sporulation protein PAI 2 [Caulifigura coniformis]